MNDENSYNLIDETWIPVLMKDGKNQTVSLGDIFADTDGAIADLALNPYERVAVFRLLLCIAQAALGPERLKDEAGWLAAKDAVGPASADYLKKWHDRFFLYGPHAFLQPDCVFPAKEDGVKPCSNLMFEMASGSNSTLFDHAAIGKRSFPAAIVGLNLIVYQNFSAGGGSPQCIWDGAITPFRGIRSAPCYEQSMLFSILCGKNLLESVWLNLLTYSAIRDSLRVDWGQPVWEFATQQRGAVSSLAKTYLGVLAPLSRAIKLHSGGSQCIIGEGVAYPSLPEWREPMASVKPNRKGAPSYVSADRTRMPWRELASILAVRETGGRKAALALRHLDSLPEEKEFTLWTGGLCWERGQAKQVDTVEWKVRLSVSLLEEPAMQRYENAINYGDRQEKSLYAATAEYAQKMKSASDEKKIKAEQIAPYSAPAERAYWDILAQAENQKLVLGVDSPTYKDDWKNATRKAAEEAYRRACPAMTARQMEAFVQGFARLGVR